jgi:glycerophosphoryl diester phosphodiesterase
VRLVAHRGFAAVEPENTVRAVRRAARVADAVEVDVRRCGSGELVVVHDRTVDRVTDGSGRVGDRSLSTLQSLSVADSGEPVPTLQAVVDAMPPDVELLVELKERGLAADALGTCLPGEPSVHVQSFSPEVVAAARDVAPSVPRSLLFSRDPDERLARARALDCEAVAIHLDLVDAALVDAAQDAGLDVYAWTVSDPAEATALAGTGVDGLVTDVPDVRQD